MQFFAFLTLVTAKTFRETATILSTVNIEMAVKQGFSS